MSGQLAFYSNAGCAEPFPNGNEGQVLTIVNDCPEWSNSGDIYVNGGSYDPATMTITLVDNSDTTPDITIQLTDLVNDLISSPTTIVSGAGTTADAWQVAAFTANDNGDGTVTFSYPDGTGNIVDLGWDQLVDNGDGTYTHTNRDGTTYIVDTNETITALTNNGDGTFSYVNEAGVNVTITQPWDQLVDNGNGTYTHTNFNGLQFTITEGTVSTLTDLGTSFTHNDGAGGITNITLPWDQLVDNGDGTYTYTRRNGTQFIVDTNDPVQNLNATFVCDVLNNNDPTFTDDGVGNWALNIPPTSTARLNKPAVPNVALVANTVTLVNTLTNTAWDTCGEMDNGDNTNLNIPRTGRYQVFIAAGFNDGNNGDGVAVQLFRNGIGPVMQGVETRVVAPGGTIVPNPTASNVFNLTAGDMLSLRVWAEGAGWNLTSASLTVVEVK